MHAVASLQSKYAFEGLLYDAVLECNPDLLDSLPIGKVVGNSSQTLRQCKDPKVFFSALDQNAIPHPEVSYESIQDPTDSWLVKHTISSGGTGICVYVEDETSGESIYFQRKIDGVSFSLTFLANGDELKPIGFNTLWCETLGESMPYAYAGAITSVDLTEQQRYTTINYATALAREFKLVGLNSIDCILSGDGIYVLEINPRIPATYELYETKQGDLMKEHVEACVSAKLAATQRKQLLRAHAIVYAPQLIRVPASLDWPLWTADRPHQEEVIHKYEPVCSVFAGGKNVAQVREMIHTRKKTIIRKLMH
jgi:predicted ATP-grasp superfamily ATP-dependent carboligase